MNIASYIVQQVLWNITRRLAYMNEYERDSATLEDVQRFCIAKSLGCYPVLIHEGELPLVYKQVEEFIRVRSRRDLPIAQFQRRFFDRRLEDNVEIGGMLGISEEIREVSYVTPKIIKLGLEVSSDFELFPYFESGIDYDFHLEDDTLKDIKLLIEWHTHPDNEEISLGDALGDIRPKIGLNENEEQSINGEKELTLKEFFKLFYNADLLTTIYLPTSDRFLWYDFVAVESK